MEYEELMAKIQQWHDCDDHRKIISAIEALPERDYNLTSLLARAYNNLSAVSGWGRPAAEKAAVLLEDIKEQGQGDALWHYRMGYALYCLGRDEEALSCFQRAAELDPDDPDALYFMERCRRALAFQPGGRAIVAVDEEDAGEEYPFCITLHLNARLQPVHRHTLEDVLAEMLERRGFGTVEGGGTAMSPSGEVCSCDIEVYLKYGTERALDALVQAAEYLEAPKGSRLLYKGTDGQRYERPLGSLEGLAVYLNGTELPDEVYQDCDVNDVIAQAEQRLGDAGCLMSWWEGPRDTALYFYGASCAAMLDALRPLLDEHPLCRKCRTERIA